MTNDTKNERDNKEYKEGYEDGRKNYWFQSLGRVQFSSHKDPYRSGLQAGREDRWKYGNTSKDVDLSTTTYTPPKGSFKSSRSSASYKSARSSSYKAVAPHSGSTSITKSILFIAATIALLFVDLLIFIKGVLMMQDGDLTGIFLVVIGIPGGVVGYFLIGVGESKSLVNLLDAIFY